MILMNVDVFEKLNQRMHFKGSAHIGTKETSDLDADFVCC